MSIKKLLCVMSVIVLASCGGGGGGGNDASSSRSLATSLDQLVGNWTAPDFVELDDTVQEMYFTITESGVVDAYGYLPTVGNCYLRIDNVFTIESYVNDTFILTETTGGSYIVVKAYIEGDGVLVFEDQDDTSDTIEFVPSDVVYSDLGLCLIKPENGVSAFTLDFAL